MEDRKKENGAVLRTVKTRGFTTLDNNIFKNKNLSFKAKGLLCVCLSLPDNWGFSVAGLQSLSTDGRVSVENAIKELTAQGYLVVTKERSNKGFFQSIYTFYEDPQENENLTNVENLQRVNDSGLTTPENPQLFNDSSQTATDNIELLNTNNKELILNNQIPLIENLEIFKPIDLFNLYKSICVHFAQPRDLTEEREKKAALRLKKQPKKEFWQIVFENAEKSKMLRDSDKKWFCFDWVLKNDANAVKMYEGNYGCGYENKFENLPPVTNLKVVSGDKYANIYNKRA